MEINDVTLSTGGRKNDEASDRAKEEEDDEMEKKKKKKKKRKWVRKRLWPLVVKVSGSLCGAPPGVVSTGALISH